MKKYSNFSKLISLLIILLSSNLNAQSTSKRGTFNFDFGVPLNNKMQMITGNSSSRTSSSNSKMFFTFDLGYSHKFFRKFDYQLDLFYIKSQFNGPSFNLDCGGIYVGENVYSEFTIQDLRLNFNLARSFNLGNNINISLNTGFGFHTLPYGWNLTVSHIYSEQQDSSIKNFRELAKSIKLNRRGSPAFSYVFGLRLNRTITNHFTANLKFMYTAILYPGIMAFGDYCNVYKNVGIGSPDENGRSFNYELINQEIYSCTLGISYKFK